MSTVETNNRLADPELLTDLCAHVAAGGTLANFCSEQSLIYKLVNRWIEDNEDRAKRYKLALDIREQHAKDLIIAELIAYLRADVTTCFDEQGNLRRLHDMGPNERRLIAGVKFRELLDRQKNSEGQVENVHIGNMIEIKFWDKPRSIETFMKHLAMLVDRKDLTSGGKSYAELISGSMAKEETAT